MTLKRAREICRDWDKFNNEEPLKDRDELVRLTSEKVKCTESECEEAHFVVRDEKRRLESIEFEKQYSAWENTHH